MILDALFSLIETVVNGVLGLLPSVPAPDMSGWVSGLAPIWTHAAWLNKYVPLDQAAIMLGVLVGAWVVLYTVRFTIWCLTKVYALGGD